MALLRVHAQVSASIAEEQSLRQQTFKANELLVNEEPDKRDLLLGRSNERNIGDLKASLSGQNLTKTSILKW